MTQSTIAFERANPLQQLTGLSRAMALPHEYPPTRFPSFPALERTAVIGFNVPTAASVPAQGWRALLCRQAAYPLWVDMPEGLAWAYTLDFNPDVVQRLGAAREAVLLPQISRWSVGNNLSSASQIGVSGCMAPISGYPIVAYDFMSGPAPWFYVPAGGTVHVDFNMDAGTMGVTDPDVSVDFQLWSSPGEYAEGGISLDLVWASTTRSMSNRRLMLTGGWYRLAKLVCNATGYGATAANYSIGVAVLNTDTTTISYGNLSVRSTISAVGLSGLRTLAPAAAPPEFANSVLPYTSTRTTAAACLFTNVTKVLNKEGTVLCGRLNPTVKNVWNFGASDLVNLHPAEKQLLGLETGAYTFCPPSTDLSSFWDYTLSTASGAQPAPVFRLDNDSLVNCLSFSDPDGGTSLAINLDWHMEFRTSSALWQIALSTTPIEILHQAQLSLVACGFFFQNETHKSALNRIMPSLKSAALKLLPTVAAMHPVSSMAYNVGKAILSNKPRPGPKATTLKASSRSDAKPPKTQPKKKAQPQPAKQKR